MKFTASIVASLLASVAVARPRAAEEGDTLPQKSRVTAFVVDDQGNPSVECWEITNMVDDQQTYRTQRADGSKANAYALPLASGRELEGLDILTWPSLSPIWPPSQDAVQAEWFNLAGAISMISMQSGLIQFIVNAATHSTNDDNYENHIFSLENGDDWFYFEDQYTGSSLARSANAAPYPFSISTISATETEVLRLRFNSRPKHTVLHKGGCSFTGIQTPAEDSAHRAKTSRKHSPLTVQVNIEEDL